MTTEPMAWPEHGPSTSLDEDVSEIWDRCEESIAGHVSHKRAPRAEPEEDFDDFQAGHEEEILELAPSPRPTEQPRAHVESDELLNLLNASPPPPALDASLVEESLEKEVLSSLEGEVDEWISDAEIGSDPSEEVSSPDSQSAQEWIPQPTEAADGEVNPAPKEMSGEEPSDEESSVQENLLPGELENNTSATQTPPSDPGEYDDPCSPPFADESEDEEANEDLAPCQQQGSSGDMEPEQPLPAVLSAVLLPPQQVELLPENRQESAPLGGNQEAVRQVLGQGSAPLSAVAMEPPGRGGAAFQRSGCGVAARERQGRVGGGTEGESKTADVEGGQKQGGLGRDQVLRRGLGATQSKAPQTREWKTEKFIFKGLKTIGMESDCGDDSQSDSGVSADFSPCSTWENSMSTPQGSPPNETPIEREIRRSMEREQSLRRLRGLPTATPQYVEIPVRKTVMKPSLPTKAERGQGKDRNFAGKKMQQEIHKEAKREQDLVKLGKVPGGYDKGTVPQLKERKELFEAFQKPSDTASAASRRSRTTSRSSSVGEVQVTTAGNQENAPASRELLSPNPKTGSPAPSVTRGLSLSEGKGQQVIIVETCLSVPAHKGNHAKPQAQITIVDSGARRASPPKAGVTVESKPTVRKEEKEVAPAEDEEEMVPKENPFFKLRSSTNLIKVEKDIREAREREQELRKQRISLYGGRGAAQGGMGARSASLDAKTPPPAAVAENGPAAPASPASPASTASTASPDGDSSPSKASKAGTGSPAARPSLGKLGVWPPPQTQKEEEDRPGRPEVARSPHAPRQKTPLVQRWESGLINGCNQGDD